MLKRLAAVGGKHLKLQPPSGGCVLKHVKAVQKMQSACPAAFRRLCVETVKCNRPKPAKLPAAFRRLCVETLQAIGVIY